jgi:hypothetical protein
MDWIDEMKINVNVNVNVNCTYSHTCNVITLATVGLTLPDTKPVGSATPPDIIMDSLRKIKSQSDDATHISKATIIQFVFFFCEIDIMHLVWLCFEPTK